MFDGILSLVILGSDALIIVTVIGNARSMAKSRRQWLSTYDARSVAFEKELEVRTMRAFAAGIDFAITGRRDGWINPNTSSIRISRVGPDGVSPEAPDQPE